MSHFDLTSVLLRNRRLLPLFLLFLMLIPIWATPQPVFGDYSNHLLQAHVVLHYDDPVLAYADYYELVPRWYLNTTALSTLLLVGFGQVLPMDVAGRLVLSLYLILFMGGFKLLLDRAGTTWPLLLLAPVLAYNFTFTSGFINFSWGMALGLYALVCYLHWRERGQARDLWWLALLLLLICLAHVLAWLLWLLVLGAMNAGERRPPRQVGALWLAMTSGVPLLAITRPSFALVAMLIAPGLWLAGWLFQRLRLPTYLLGVFGLLAAFAGYQLRILVRLPEPLQGMILPFAIYNRFEKQVTPLRLFTIPHQFTPPDLWLAGLNLALLACVVLLAGLVVWQSWRHAHKAQAHWLRALGLLTLVYFLLPSRTYDIVIVEPRVLLVVMLLAVVAMPPLVRGSRMARMFMVSAVAACLVSVATLGYITHFNGQQIYAWRDELSVIPPARNLLVLVNASQDERNFPNALRLFNTVYDGRHLLNLYAIEQGGFASVTFNNGPIHLRPDIPLPDTRSGFENTQFVIETCSALRAVYGAVVVLMQETPPELASELDQCFDVGLPMSHMDVWFP